MPELSLIPQPTHVKRHEGHLVLTTATRILSDDSLAGEVSYLTAALQRALGPLSMDDATTTIRLSLNPALSTLGREGYRLHVNANGIEIEALSNTGIFYGVQTLLQLLPPAVYGKGPRNNLTWTLPFVEIEDASRFFWRGAMLDSSRHFQPVEFIYKFIDLLALHKLNTFHWHLTDDQGWRIEIKKYPLLTEVGAWRKGTWQGHNDCPSSHDGIRYGGFYTQDQIRDIVRYAAERHITILPEIEMPGHAQSALAAYPEFGCAQSSIEVWPQWGINESCLYSPTEKTFAFLQDILREVMDLFPGKFIHVGGDEAVKKQWDEHPDLPAWLKISGAKDTHELQSYFIRRMDRFLADQGRRLIGWDEILEGGLAEGASVMSWRGIEGGIAAAKKGHDVVMAPTSHTYFDAYQSENIADEPLAIGSFVPLEKVHAYDPVPVELSPEEAHHVMGVQGQLWAEYLPNTNHVEYMAFPRLSALAEVGWSKLPRRPYAEFRQALETHLKRLNVLGTRYRPPIESE